MPLTLPLPSWVPWWGQLLILAIAILFGLAFLMMPFAVFGLKGRLDFLEAQLDDIHSELRMVATRLPDPDRRPARPAEPVVQEIVSAPLPPLPLRNRTAEAAPKPFATTPSEATPAPRRPRAADDWSTREPSAYDEEDGARRTLRAPREPEPRPVERSRAEPTLRWPPPR